MSWNNSMAMYLIVGNISKDDPKGGVYRIIIDYVKFNTSPLTLNFSFSLSPSSLPPKSNSTLQLELFPLPQILTLQSAGPKTVASIFTVA